MPNHRKKKAGAATTQGSDPAVDGKEVQPAFFPYARYTSIVGVHTTLLAFSALFVPRTNVLFELAKQLDWEEGQLTSRDKPQHPFLEPLTQSPVATLTCICLAVGLLQSWWASWLRGWWIDITLEGTKGEKKARKLGITRVKLEEFSRAWTAVLICSFAFHFVFVLFGAPVLSKVLHTYSLALTTSILIVLPPAYTFGPPSFGPDSAALVSRLTWVRLFAETSVRSPIERAIVYPAIGALLGGWIGIIPTALDWDRPWQAWPLTPAFGCIVGYITASIFAVAINGTAFLAEQVTLQTEAASAAKSK
ncbi:hypothetical protein BDN72DRAFT_798153 [Pluteus cervinus]|uniref:Uncharacterized protein n=1 Tax=Pluteus cervinus TaxID=181527 RepID=A0ACD3AR03_9AGAR|nr:hypothetical protein BDN72DRAFT_798153 [Pluteus cervinus]